MALVFVLVVGGERGGGGGVGRDSAEVVQTDGLVDRLNIL